MNKSDIVKIRIEPHKKELWQRYADSCMPQLSMTELVTLAVDYVVSGRKDNLNNRESKGIDWQAIAWAMPSTVKSEGYISDFESEAKQEISRKQERKQAYLAGELG